jgi:hypothetical protein
MMAVNDSGPAPVDDPVGVLEPPQGEGDGMAEPPGDGTPPPDPAEVEAYMQREREGQQMEEMGQATFYKQKFEQAAQQLQGAQEQADAAGQQVQQLTEQQAQSQQMQQQAMTQAQQIQDAAMANAQAAQGAAASAMQRSLASSNELIQQQDLSAKMRDAAQGLKAQIQQLALQALPPATTFEAGSAIAPPLAAPGQDPMAQTQVDPNAPQPDPNADPNAAAGAPPADPAQAAAPPADPAAGGAAPAGGQPAAPAAPPPAATGQSAPAPQAADQAKTAHDRFVGALMGGAAGAAGGYAESQMSNDGLRGKVQQLEARESSGEGGFGNALNLAQARMRLAAGDLAEKHPAGASLMGGAMGAVAGFNVAPDVRDMINQVRGG